MAFTPSGDWSASTPLVSHVKPFVRNTRVTRVLDMAGDSTLMPQIDEDDEEGCSNGIMMAGQDQFEGCSNGMLLTGIGGEELSPLQPSGVAASMQLQMSRLQDQVTSLTGTRGRAMV